MESAAQSRRLGLKNRRRISVAGFALYVVAALVAASPWLTGVYTAMQQRTMLGRMERDFDASANAAKSREVTPSAQRNRGPFDGWAAEDATYWKRLGDGKVFGRITIRKIGLNMAIVKGVSKADLKLGPGWMPTTDMPGPTGNAVISGHRTTYLAPFKRILELKKGDEVRIESPFRVYTYRVYKTSIVDPGNKDVLAYNRRPMLTMTACHPEYSDAQRLVVQAYLEGVTKRR